MSDSRKLAGYAANLRYEDIPAEVIQRAKICIADTIAAASYGAALPWSRIVIAYATQQGASGDAVILGTPHKVAPAAAALANGALSHAFELDSLCHPSVGVHPGAGLTSPGLAVAQQCGASGRDLLTAFVAASEVMYRIGDAGRHSSEHLGFHAPGLTGVFGGAIVAGRLLGLDAERLTHALGIAGSLCSGLMEFSKSGGMTKRLHLGRAAEGGVMAAYLARDGFTGPQTVLEGKYGFLSAFCEETDPLRLTRALGEEWHTLKIMLKRYASHITAHVPVTAALDLRAEHAIDIRNVQSVSIATHDKVFSHHNILEPKDLGMAQYSVPFCTALALKLDPVDPGSFSETALADEDIRRVCRNTEVSILPEGERQGRFSTHLVIRMKDGREFRREAHDYEGMPSRPLSAEQLAAKFIKLATPAGLREPARLFERLMQLEREAGLAGLIA